MADDIDDMPRSNAGTVFKVVLAILLLVGALGALGWYTWGLRKRHERSEDSLAAAVGEKATLQSKLDAEKQHSGDLDKLLAACGTERDTAKTAGKETEKLSKDLQANLQASKAELDDLRKQRAEADKRIAAFSDLTEKFRKMIDTGKIQVQVRKGRMVMKLPAGVLFDSGSAELSRPGELALMEVAVILKGFPDRDFMVAGHTDKVPPAKGAKYASNWELSTLRAVKVTEFLIGAGMKAEHLVAAGYGEHDPIPKASLNEQRRIEIVLLPKIEELPAMPDMDDKQDKQK